MAASAIPYSSFVGQTARAMDPYMREAHTMVETAMSRLPGLREFLPVRRDLFGAPVSRGESVGPEFGSPIYSSYETTDPVYKALENSQARIRPPQRVLDGQRMNNDEWDRMNIVPGQMAYEALSRRSKQRDWELPASAGGLTEYARKEITKYIFEQARSGVRDQIRKDRFNKRVKEVGRGQAQREYLGARRGIEFTETGEIR